jgi:endoglycosylceramidase
MRTRPSLPSRLSGASLIALTGALLLGCEGEGPEVATTRAALSAPPTLSSRRLSVEGTRLFDELGREVVLRGVNVGNRAKMPPYLPFDLRADESVAAAADDFFTRVAALGADGVRLTFAWEAYEPTRGGYDEGYLARYRLLLDAAHAHGLSVIVDFHQDAFASAFCGDGFPLWALGPVSHGAAHYDCGFPMWAIPALLPFTSVSAAFDRLWNNADGLQDSMEVAWRRVAAALAGHPAVAAFEVMNEPAPGSVAVDTFDGVILPAFTARMGRAIQAAAGATVPVLWDARINTAAPSSALRPPPLPGAVFAPHYYEAMATLGFPFVIEGAIKGDLTAQFAARERWNMPVLVGEFGVPNHNWAKAAYLDFVLDTLDSLRGHAMMWDVSASATQWNGESFSALNPDRTEQPWVPSFVRAYPRAVAGTIAAFSWDASARRFTLDVTAATDGVTEVYLPRRHLGSSPRISVVGAIASQWIATRELLLVVASPGASYRVSVSP